MLLLIFGAGACYDSVPTSPAETNIAMTEHAIIEHTPELSRSVRRAAKPLVQNAISSNQISLLFSANGGIRGVR